VLAPPAAPQAARAAGWVPADGEATPGEGAAAAPTGASEGAGSGAGGGDGGGVAAVIGARLLAAKCVLDELEEGRKDYKKKFARLEKEQRQQDQPRSDSSDGSEGGGSGSGDDEGAAPRGGRSASIEEGSSEGGEDASGDAEDGGPRRRRGGAGAAGGGGSGGDEEVELDDVALAALGKLARKRWAGRGVSGVLAASWGPVWTLPANVRASWSKATLRRQTGRPALPAVRVHCRCHRRCC
jgi:hypothetical protein